jgi:hypothetical protein
MSALPIGMSPGSSALPPEPPLPFWPAEAPAEPLGLPEPALSGGPPALTGPPGADESDDSRRPEQHSVQAPTRQTQLKQRLDTGARVFRAGLRDR